MAARFHYLYQLCCDILSLSSAPLAARVTDGWRKPESRPPILRLRPAGHDGLRLKWMTNKGRASRFLEGSNARGSVPVNCSGTIALGEKTKPVCSQLVPSSRRMLGRSPGWLGAAACVLLKTRVSANDYPSGRVLRHHQTQFRSVTIKLEQIRADWLLNYNQAPVVSERPCLTM